MRHSTGSRAALVIAAVLIGGAVAFAWARSSQVVLTTEAALFAPTRGWEQLGGPSYVRNCAACHGRDGEGWDQYPGLGDTGKLFSAPGGPAYVVDVHVHGLTSDRWRAPMPPMGHIHDVELAAVIRYVLTNFGNESVLHPRARLPGPEDVAARRRVPLTPWEVEERRP